MKKPTKLKFSITRRNLLKGSTLVTVGGALAFGVGSLPILKGKELLLRPPGALDEDKFLASCIKCGQCLQVCPPQVVLLGNIGKGFGIGTPYIIPREGACILCKGLPCVLACPTGALDHDISEGKEADMGLAFLETPETCLSLNGINDIIFFLEKIATDPKPQNSPHLPTVVQGLVDRLNTYEKEQWKSQLEIENITNKQIPTIIKKLDKLQLNWLLEFTKTTKLAKQTCRVCLEECPIKEESPIVFQKKIDSKTGKEYVIPVVKRTCVGCGVCEMKCPTSTPSIVIKPRMKWKEEV